MWMGSLWGDGGKLRGFLSCGFCSLCEVGCASSPGRRVCCEAGDLRVGKFKISHVGLVGESRGNTEVLLGWVENPVKLGCHGFLPHTLNEVAISIQSGTRHRGCGGSRGHLWLFSFGYLAQPITEACPFTSSGVPESATPIHRCSWGPGRHLLSIA